LPLIVGIGASAGDLSAFKAFFAALPADSGIGFVLVWQLDLSHESILTELVGRQTRMLAVEAEDGMPVAANRVHIIPPDATLTIADGVLHVERPAQCRFPIDTFFASLAADQRENAVGIVLSGIGGDGTLGVGMIREHDGLTLARSGHEDSAMTGMPRSAAAAGRVDHVLRVEEMPARLVAYQQHLIEAASRKDNHAAHQVTAQRLAMITALLRSELGHDFANYNEKTLVRRIQRHMHGLRIYQVCDYIRHLREAPRERERLFQELLIRATAFFRDPLAFEALETDILPALLAAKGDADQVRVWVPGCATGEEVYSLAILVKEEMERRAITPKVLIFGTDIDPKAVAIARAGRYAKPKFGLSPERLGRWFVAEHDAYRVIPEIREMCIFCAHSVVKDPTFSKLDLVSCRNLLIYLNPEPRERVVRTFHYALRPGGVLFLGPSEAPARDGHLFETIDARHRLFRRRDTIAPTGLPDFRSPAETPPRAPRLTSHPAARATPDGAAATGVHRRLRIKPRDPTRAAPVIVAPVAGAGRDPGLTVVACKDASNSGELAKAKGPAEPRDRFAQTLEEELFWTKEQLQAAIDEASRANGEIRSSAQEDQSVNEELQSSNEELETATEEMRSINEELQTLNAELTGKNDLLTRLNADMRNLLESTRIATIFLDSGLRIKGFTPACTGIFHLRDTDRGRPVTDIANHLDHLDLRNDVATVLRELSVVEREVRTAETGTTFIMRIRPYQTVDDAVDGVVITFVDITERRRTEEALKEHAAIIEFARDAVVSISPDGRVRSWNPGAERLFGYPAETAIGWPIAFLSVPDQIGRHAASIAKVRKGEVPGPVETILRRRDGTDVHVELTLTAIRGADGAVMAVAAIIRDISERKRAEAQSTLLLHELSHRVKNALASVQSLALETLRTAPTLDVFREAFVARLMALSSAHDLLVEREWRDAGLRDVLEAELAPYQSVGYVRWTATGPDIRLTPKMTLALGMAFHELATNASKFGALSVSAGHIDISWWGENAKDGRRLHVLWVERDGPAVETPGRKGFGSRLIAEGLAFELDGPVQLDYLPTGIRCTMDVPMESGSA
jgi:two-component system CheB/CheR fusion protein